MVDSIDKIPLNQAVTAAVLNRKIEEINDALNISISGPGTSVTQSRYGRSISVKPKGDRRMYIAEVDSDAAGGGYYNCYLQTLDATDWNTDTDPLIDADSTSVVMNLAEVGADRHELDANDRLVCWKFTDDEGNTRLVGIPALRIGTKTDNVTATSDTIGGKFMYNWLGEW